MKFSEKSAPPQALLDWLALPQDEGWRPTYKNFSGEPKKLTHESLLREQGFVCSYCGRRLSANRSDSHIDHFWPQEHFNSDSPPDKTLDYSNYFASCGPPSLSGIDAQHPSTCGDTKGNWFDKDLAILPSDPGCEARFLYAPNGLVMAVNDEVAAAKMISVLNLNHETLQYERQVILTALETDILNGELVPSDFDAEIASWRSVDSDHRLRSFGHAAARYLEDEKAQIDIK